MVQGFDECKGYKVLIDRIRGEIKWKNKKPLTKVSGDR